MNATEQALAFLLCFCFFADDERKHDGRGDDDDDDVHDSGEEEDGGGGKNVTQYANPGEDLHSHSSAKSTIAV